LHLSEAGAGQAATLAGRLAEVPLTAIVSSPLERCQETAAALAGGRSVQVLTDERFVEVGYGEWTGRPLKELAKEPLWKVVQQHPSAALFPGGESLAATQAARGGGGPGLEHPARRAGGCMWCAAHGDVIKAGAGRRAPGCTWTSSSGSWSTRASVSVVHYTPTRPFVARVNDVGGSVADLLPPKKTRRPPANRPVTPLSAVGGWLP